MRIPVTEPFPQPAVKEKAGASLDPGIMVGGHPPLAVPWEQPPQRDPLIHLHSPWKGRALCTGREAGGRRKRLPALSFPQLEWTLPPGKHEIFKRWAEDNMASVPPVDLLCWANTSKGMQPWSGVIYAPPSPGMYNIFLVLLPLDFQF